jgi:putative membrane protein
VEAEVLQALSVWFVCGSVVAIYLRARRSHPRALRRPRATAFMAGVAVLAVCLGPTMDGASDRLLWPHMVQHLLLLTVAAPLIAFGTPAWLVVGALPRGPRAWALRRLAPGALPATVAVLLGTHVVAVWLWHIPAAFELALRSEAAHLAEHATFLGTAVLAWWPIVDDRLRSRLGGGGAVAYAIALQAQAAVLGALMTFASSPWYPSYAPSEAAARIGPIVDQQAAGLAMWIPASVISLAAIVWLLFAWLAEDDTGRAPT